MTDSKPKLLLAWLLLSAHVTASEFTYQTPGASNDPHRTIRYDAGGLDINDTNNDTGLWSQGYAPLTPGDPQAIGSGSALAGVVHLSDLQADRICASVHSWNLLTGNDPTLQQAAGSTMVIPFTLSHAATVKLHFAGGGHFINANTGFQLFTGKDFFLRQGLTGSGGNVSQYLGTGIEYVSLAAGDYRLSTGTNDALTCSPFPCNLQSVSQLRMTLEIVDQTALPGDTMNKPYLPDQVSLNEDLDQQFIDTNGAMIYRGATATSVFNQTADGWYEINARSVHHITATDQGQGAALISGLQMPSNLNGQIRLQVEDINLGQFAANDVVVLADYSPQLGHLLLSGNQGIMGVTDITVMAHPSLSQQWNNRCGFANQQAIRLSFDAPVVDVVVTSSLVQDPVFTGRFE